MLIELRNLIDFIVFLGCPIKYAQRKHNLCRYLDTEQVIMRVAHSRVLCLVMVMWVTLFIKLMIKCQRD